MSRVNLNLSNIDNNNNPSLTTIRFLCTTIHRYGAGRYGSIILFRLQDHVTNASTDRNEHRQQRMRGAG